MSNTIELNDVNSNTELLSGDGRSPRIPFRFVMLILIFSGYICVFALRTNLSIAIVAMTVAPSEIDPKQHDNKTAGQCPVPHTAQTANGTSPLPKHPGSFTWSEQDKGQILAAFFYGYAITQLPGGYLAERFGAHRVIAIGIFGTALFTIITPPFAVYSPWALWALRFIEGLFEGVMLPAVSCFWSHWAPVGERTLLYGIGNAGAQLGNILSTLLTGIIADQFGWPWIFYIFGGLGVLWCVPWYFIAASKPSESKYITTKERLMIEAASDRVRLTSAKPPVPWLKLAKSPAVYAICAGQIGIGWDFFTYLAELPTYMSNVLKFNVTQSGFLSSLPYLALWAVQTTSSILADKLRGTGSQAASPESKRAAVRKTTWIRRVSNALGLIVPAIFIVFVPLAGCNHLVAVTILTIALAFLGFTQAGCSINHMDIASEYAGVLMGFINTVSTAPGFIAPIIAAWLITRGTVAEQNTIPSWAPFFYLTGGVSLVCGIISMFATAERLPWLDHYLLSHENKQTVSVTNNLKQPSSNR